jgi:hypothetical protein
MGDTVTIKVTEEWQKVFSELGKSFSFANEGPCSIYISESARKPIGKGRGFPYAPGERGRESVVSSPFWVRAVKGVSDDNAFFHFGEIPSINT